ncbi:Ankyrin [Ectocarpus siliculosus]|uniref:Ankyrin n=1 Tax=Ectocarpus siliculosus TaxID=2880 RepID=D7G7I9_ECTSI|nr:Ankyrin [Ectocarpus siliculosus]|eukprot:CBJ27731.1 Ankyrin [Ectocarpus siliculosus]
MDVHAAALNGDVEDVRRYIAGSGDPNILNDAGITPLHSAAVQGQWEVIRVLVAAGADTDLKVCRDGGKGGATHDASPLLLAVVGGHLEAARVLLEGGAEVGAKNSKGLTPLHVSCLKPNPEMVSLLLLWGADTNARDRKKRTPEQIVDAASVESDAGGTQGPAEVEQPASSVNVHSNNQAPAGATAASAHDAASVVTAPATGGGKGGAAGAPAATSAAVEFASRAVLEGEYELEKIGQKFYHKYSGNSAGYMDRIRPYARQVVEVCQWLHRLGIVWGDVKPENFVEGQDDDLKAIDFDSACSLSGGMASLDKDVAERVQRRFSADHVLTPRYCAPERARASVSGESCLATKATDIWSAGMVLFWLLTGQDYFENGLADEEVVMTLCSSGFTVSLAGVDPKQEQARNLLGTMLSHIPQGRGSMDSVLGRAFFAGGASVTAAKMQADMAASLGGVSSRLEATIREEGGATRSLLDESMKRLESRADEILSKLGRMDRMLDHLVDGNADCPRLFVLTPVEGSQEIWKPDTWFSDYNLLTFLCAHDLAPIGKGIKVPCPRSNLEKWAPAIQASAFVLKLGSKAACMTVGVSPAAVDGMSAALGINFLAGRKVSAALRSAAGKALGDVKGSRSEDAKHDTAGNQTLRTEERSETPDEEEGRILTGEAYEALVSFLDENVPSWRATLAVDMTKAIRGDGKASVWRSIPSEIT